LLLDEGLGRPEHPIYDETQEWQQQGKQESGQGEENVSIPLHAIADSMDDRSKPEQNYENRAHQDHNQKHGRMSDIQNEFIKIAIDPVFHIYILI
jgi:hypothetical protein